MFATPQHREASDRIVPQTKISAGFPATTAAKSPAACNARNNAALVQLEKNTRGSLSAREDSQHFGAAARRCHRGILNDYTVSEGGQGKQA